MYSFRVKRLPVVDEENHLIGIVSRADVLSVYSRPDTDIQQEIRTAGPGWLNVSVRNGVVTLEGHPEDAASGQEIVAEAWHTEGVVSVRDRLSYPPTSCVEGA
jgi:CBS-domain-containing membrane protein